VTEPGVDPARDPAHDPAIRLLEPGGGLARAIPHYEDRAEQRQMSAAVARALADERPLIVEAGTGTGKTLAYLIPALLSGKRVVVSTGTRALQDQIARHDLPLLRTILARPFNAVVLKGIGNYVCQRRLAEVASRGDASPELATLIDWARRTETGDRAEVEWLAEDAPLWRELTTTPDARVGPRCPHFERCFITQARRRADEAELVLVNHHLYFADLALRTAFPGARVLPVHDAVIFDEAHQLEDIATEHFGARVSSTALGQLVRDAHLGLARMPLWTGRAADDVIHAVERRGVALFALLRGALQVGEAGRVPLPPELFEHPDRKRAWFDLDTALEDLARVAEAEAEPPPDEDVPEDAAARATLAGLARRARALRDDLATIAEQRQRSQVYWGEARPTGVYLMASPIAVGELMRTHVVGAGATPIFTSATLTAAGDFGYVRSQLGLEDPDIDELMVASPFDYTRQAMLYVPRDLPLPAEDGFAAAATARTLELLELTAGRAFLLFTSHRALRDAAVRLAAAPYPKLIQGEAPRQALIERFRATPNAVLLGTASFWEGVDVPGDALSLVVIDKLPFAVHTDPLVAARAQACAAAGKDPFETLQLPAAAIALKQGFGRLIRRRDDRGIVAILDGRVVSRNYGRTFLGTLPEGLPRTSALEQVRRWWRTEAPS
jgi:ATP-dependent DNA helicase DinG